MLLDKIYLHVLFESNASHCFVSPEFIEKLSGDPSKMDHVLCVNTLVASIPHTDVIFRNFPLSIGGRNLLVDLVKIVMRSFDLILGMDWLAKYEVIIDCKSKLVSLTTPKDENLNIRGATLKKQSRPSLLCTPSQ